MLNVSNNYHYYMFVACLKNIYTKECEQLLHGYIHFHRHLMNCAKRYRWFVHLRSFRRFVIPHFLQINVTIFNSKYLNKPAMPVDYFSEMVKFALFNNLYIVVKRMGILPFEKKWCQSRI